MGLKVRSLRGLNRANAASVTIKVQHDMWGSLQAEPPLSHGFGGDTVAIDVDITGSLIP